MQETAKLTLTIDGKEQTIDLPVVIGSEGVKAIYVGALHAKTGFVCLDTVFMHSASKMSAASIEKAMARVISPT